VAANPDLSFEGAYTPEDLPRIYGAVHFSWLIDRYEAGANSEWLLPNRLYEGCRFGAVPIALEGTETARFLGRERLGPALRSATPEALGVALSRLGRDDVARLRGAVLARPATLWSVNAGECADLVRAMAQAGAAPGADRNVSSEALT
jgi:succinoglycan biosynthesis protein ExoL